MGGDKKNQSKTKPNGLKRCELPLTEKVRYLEFDYLSTWHPIETATSLLSPLRLPLPHSPRFMPIFNLVSIFIFIFIFPFHSPVPTNPNLDHHFLNPAITGIQCSYPTPHVDVSTKPSSRYGLRPPRWKLEKLLYSLCVRAYVLRVHLHHLRSTVLAYQLSFVYYLSDERTCSLVSLSL